MGAGENHNLSHDNQNIDISGGSNSSISLFVSLYLVILAFFLLLNSVSAIKDEDKEGVLEGIRDKFSASKHDYKTEIYNKYNSAGYDLELTKYASDIADIVQQSVTLFQANIEEKGDLIEITSPLDLFFNDENEYIRAEQDLFLDEISNELKKLDSLVKIDVAFIIGTSNLASNDLAILRSSSFADALIKRGVTEGSILIGIDSSLAGDIIKMNFYVRKLPEIIEQPTAPKTK